VIANVLLGCATMVACIVLQCLVVALVLLYLRNRQAARRLRGTFWESARLLIETMLILLVGNLVQIALWACLFLQLDEFSDFPTAYYHSTVNFSTLGYGDIVMSEERRLLGGLEAANGVLMFGLTTSALYAVVQALSQRVLRQHFPKLSAGGATGVHAVATAAPPAPEPPAPVPVPSSQRPPPMTRPK